MTKSSSSKRFDLKQDVTNKIIERIESVGKFEMPFSTYAGSPCNFKSGREYRGINVILTLFAGFSSPYWGTPKQWMEAGANIKGGKCTQIVFWSTKMKKDESGNETNVVDYMFPKYHNVLNADQVTGWEAPETGEDKKDETEIIATADEFFKNLGVETFYASGRACYIPLSDKIQMPFREDFTATKTSTATETFYSTKGHENMHATMHKDRCNRDMDSYALEELVAEIGSAMLCCQLGISSEMRDDHISYIKSWLKALKNDKNAIFTAAKKSQEALDWMNEQQIVKIEKAA
tara:strand:- start:558 stop:1430 length:873 start_codon:yes stop_codon:yes gene_type:complete